MRAPAFLLALTLLAACNRGEEAPGAIGADDQRQLNEAAAMLDANSVDLDEVTEDENADAAQTTGAPE